jgi:peptidyl-prolyl cis-trans isomerase SurA
MHRMLTMKPRAIAVGLMGLASLVPLGAAAQGVRLPGAQQRSSLAAPAAVPSNVQRQADFIVAVVNAEPVTNNEVRARMARVLRQIEQSGGARPPLDVLASEVMEQLISEKAQMQLAKEIGVTVDELAIDQAAQTIARRNDVSMDEMLRRLSAEGVSREQFRLELRRQLTLQRLREREVDARVRVSEPEIDQFLREQSPQGADLARTELNIAQVLVAVPEDASDAQVAAAQARAQGVADKARAGGDFAALAREFSDAPGATNTGGQMGLRSADRYPELFVQAVGGLPVGGVAGPVRSGAGFHVLKLVEKSRGGLPVTVVQSRARHILLRTSAQLSEAAAVERLADYRRRILAGQADFAQLAREHSQDASAKQGGDLGWVNPGTFVPEFEEAMDALKPGDLSQPLISRFGVHLIQLQERREQRLSQREQREVARQAVRMKKTEDAYATWAQEVRGRAYVEYRDPPQ